MSDHPHQGGPGGPRQRARRGAIRRSILTLLAERPMHGYELIRELEERSEGRWRPSPGSIYPALQRMEENGVVTSAEVDGKRQFTLTERGRQRLEEVREVHGDAPDPWNDVAPARRGELRRHIAELTGQVRQVARFGSASQQAQAVEALETLKRELYGILASPEQAANAEPEPEP